MRCSCSQHKLNGTGPPCNCDTTSTGPFFSLPLLAPYLCNDFKLFSLLQCTFILLHVQLLAPGRCMVLSWHWILAKKKYENLTVVLNIPIPNEKNGAKNTLQNQLKMSYISLRNCVYDISVFKFLDLLCCYRVPTLSVLFFINFLQCIFFRRFTPITPRWTGN